jgi:uncharacterized membrane protein
VKIRTIFALALAALAGPMAMASPTCAAPPAVAPEDEVSFKLDVEHVFERRCMPCHAPGGEGATENGMVLSTYEGVMKGTKFGPMVVPGDPQASNLMRLIEWRASAQLRMPHNRKQLSACERGVIREWIRQGAKDN